MTLGDFRKATEALPDDTPIVEQHSWRSPHSLETGQYLGWDGSMLCLILGHAYHRAEDYGNTVLWKDKPNA